MANWIELNSGLDIEKIKEASFGKPVLIFKHSTSCSISSAAKDRLERGWDDLNSFDEVYYLDLLRHRDISNALAAEFDVRHESPQVLVIKDGVCVYHESHFGIRSREIAAAV